MTPYYSESGIEIYCGDCRSVIGELESGSVHCCVTSPPYDNLRTYNGYSWDFEATAKELYRVLVDGGIVCWNVGDSVVDGSETLTSFRQALYFKDVVGFRVHDTMIYEKTNFGHPEILPVRMTMIQDISHHAVTAHCRLEFQGSFEIDHKPERANGFPRSISALVT